MYSIEWSAFYGQVIKNENVKATVDDEKLCEANIPCPDAAEHWEL